MEDSKPMTEAEKAEAEKQVEIDEYIAAKHARARAVDNGDAANSGGLGATGSAPDFGRPKNFSGVDDNGI